MPEGTPELWSDEGSSSSDWTETGEDSDDAWDTNPDHAQKKKLEFKPPKEKKVDTKVETTHVEMEKGSGAKSDGESRGASVAIPSPRAKKEAKNKKGRDEPVKKGKETSQKSTKRKAEAAGFASDAEEVPPKEEQSDGHSIKRGKTLVETAPAIKKEDEAATTIYVAKGGRTHQWAVKRSVEVSATANISTPFVVATDAGGKVYWVTAQENGKAFAVMSTRDVRTTSGGIVGISTGVLDDEALKKLESCGFAVPHQLVVAQSRKVRQQAAKRKAAEPKCLRECDDEYDITRRVIESNAPHSEGVSEKQAVPPPKGDSPKRVRSAESDNTAFSRVAVELLEKHVVQFFAELKAATAVASTV